MPEESVHSNSSKLPLVFGLMPAWLAMAWLISKAQWFWRHRPELNFGWIVVVLCGYLFWEAAQQPILFQQRIRISNCLLGLAGVALLFVCQIYIAAFGTMPAVVAGLALGCLLVSAANLHFLFGTRGWRQFGFPFLFLLIALPMPSVLQNPMVSALQSVITQMDISLLKLAGIAAVRSGNLIRLQNGVLDIDTACSGIRSLQSTMMMALFLSQVFLGRWTGRAALFAAAIVLAVLGNVLRSFYLGWVAYAHGVAAVQEQHDPAGWSILVFTIVSMAGVAWLLRRAATASLPQQEPPAAE